MDALKDTNANSKLQVTVIVQKSILAAKQYATDYRDEQRARYRMPSKKIYLQKV
jgi:hypothetical protein